MKQPPIVVNKLNKLFLVRFNSLFNEDTYVVSTSFEEAIKSKIDVKSVELISNNVQGSDSIQDFLNQA